MAFELKIEKVLISDNLDNCCHEILTKNGIEVKAETKMSKEELLAEIPVSTIFIDVHFIIYLSSCPIIYIAVYMYSLYMQN